MFRQKKILITVIGCLVIPWAIKAATITETVSGKFILNYQKDNSLWYVNPNDKKKYPIYQASDIRVLGEKISKKIETVDFQKIAQANMSIASDQTVAKKYAGQIVSTADNNSWYINPQDLKKYFLGNGSETFNALKNSATKLNYYDFSRVHKPGTKESINEYSSWEQQEITSVMGKKFKVDIVTISLDNPRLKIITDTADPKDCTTTCRAKSVSDFVLAHKGFAGINGTYFDTSAKKAYYNFFPVYNTGKNFLTNQAQLKYWTTGPMIAFDSDNNFYFFNDTRDFQKALNLKATGGPTIKPGWRTVKLQAAMGNKPKLIAEGNNQLIDWALDTKQKTWRSTMNAIAYQAASGSKGKILLVAVHNATLPEMAETLQAMKVDYALNIDGGSSTGLYYNEEYMLGPGRNVPNAIVFAEN